MGDECHFSHVSQYSLFRIDVYKPCYRIDSSSMSFITSIGVPFSLEVFDDHFYFEFCYEI